MATILPKVGEDPLKGEVGWETTKALSGAASPRAAPSPRLLPGFLFWPNARPTVSSYLVLEFRQVPAPQLECNPFVGSVGLLYLSPFFPGQKWSQVGWYPFIFSSPPKPPLLHGLSPE